MKISAFKEKIQESDIGKRMMSGAVWSFTGTALAKFIILIAGIFCAHILTKVQYGEFGMIRSTINMFIVFGYAGLGMTATKYISEYKSEHPEKISSIYLLTNGFAIVMGLLVTLLVLVTAPFLAAKTLNSPYLTNDIRFGALLLFFTIINGAQNGVLSGLENFKAIALNTLWGGIAESGFMLLGAYFYGVGGALFGYGIGFVVLYVCNNISIRQTFRKNGIKIVASDFKLRDCRILYRFSLPATFASLMVAPVYWIVRSMLVKHNGYGDLAVYEVADQWKTIILFIPTAVSQIVLPILSSMVNVDKSKYWKVLKLNIILNGGIAFLSALLVGLFSPMIVSFYGSDFTDYWPLIFLAASTIFTSVTNVAGMAIASKSKMWTGFGFNLCWACMLIGCSYYFINKEYGATGIAMSILISYLLLFVMQVVYLKQTNK